MFWVAHAVELGGWPIAQCGMEAFAIVRGFQKGSDSGSCLGQVAVFDAMHLLVLKRLHEALGFSIVVRVAFAAHTDLDTVRGEQLCVLAASVLHAAVGVMNQPGGNTAPLDGHAQSADGEFRFQSSFERPADHQTRIGIQDHGQIHELLPQTEVGEIGNPELIRRHRHEVPGQVRIDPEAMGRVGGDVKLPFPQAEQVVLAQDAADALVVHFPALPL